MTHRTAPCEPWPIDETCCTMPEAATEEFIETWQAVATQMLWAAGGRIHGTCEVVARPCLRSCLPGLLSAHSGGWIPMMRPDGQWVNITTCACAGDCACGQLCEIILEGPVASVDEVTIGGVVVTDWRLDQVGGQTRLLRTGSGCWPSCQDVLADCDADDSFCVTYQQGIVLSATAVAANSELTCELVKACIPGCNCRLPRNIQSKVRTGVTQTFDTSKTWIRNLPLVAAWLDEVNPAGLARPLRVISPDVRGQRSHG